VKDREIHVAVRILRREAPKWQTPVVTLIAEASDSTTAQASRRLFALADSPENMVRLSAKKIEQVIFPVGFYRTKAKTILEICRNLNENYRGRVPDEIDELIKFKGVGRKTANLVVTLGYNKPGICVDTHVHRISNRWGYIKTSTPEKTEAALRQKLPKQYWIEYNDLLVSFGQQLCRPISPLCSQCPVAKYCSQIGVTVKR
jgi:endonuclease-3